MGNRARHWKLAELNLIVVSHVSHNPALQSPSHSKYVDLKVKALYTMQWMDSVC